MSKHDRKPELLAKVDLQRVVDAVAEKTAAAEVDGRGICDDEPGTDPHEDVHVPVAVSAADLKARVSRSGVSHSSRKVSTCPRKDR